MVDAAGHRAVRNQVRLVPLHLGQNAKCFSTKLSAEIVTSHVFISSGIEAILDLAQRWQLDHLHESLGACLEFKSRRKSARRDTIAIDGFDDSPPTYALILYGILKKGSNCDGRSF